MRAKIKKMLIYDPVCKIQIFNDWKDVKEPKELSEDVPHYIVVKGVLYERYWTEF